MPEPNDRTVPPRADQTAPLPDQPTAASRTARTEVQLYQPVQFNAPGLPVVPGYTVLREVGRGGMGVVYAAHDPTFEREVAVKVMHAGQDAGRFVVESRITAQLPHPGVPPVYALGILSDGRPYLALKLIRGRTLTAAIDDPESDLSDLLAAFERICETVGFAHSKGFIHRDLKPSNVMVGTFGEVLVMDWGLAKQLSGDREPPAGPPGPSAPSQGARAPRGADTTRVGEVKGTPAYMAPEQARGEPVDARADVFALGGILAAVLTGKPPFLGRNAMDTVLKAARCELDECHTRLGDCGEDAELVAVARRALAPDPADRFASGAEVADAIADYRTGVEERLQRVERERAVAATEAREQRKRRRVQLLLAGAVVLLLSGAAAFAVWETNARAARARKAEQEATERMYQAERAERTGRNALDLAVALRGQLKFAEADRALEQGRAAAHLAAPDLVRLLDRARTDTLFAQELDTIRYQKWEWTAGPIASPGGFNERAAPGRYEAAFAARGLHLRESGPAEVARALAAFPIARELVAALDDWALFEPDPAVRARLLEVARRADPDPWRDAFRSPTAWADRGALVTLARTARPDTTPPTVLVALALVMGSHGLDSAPLLIAARATHPDDFGLAFALGLCYANRQDFLSAVGPYEAARAIRPDNLSARNNLGAAHYSIGNFGIATTVFRENVRRDPKSVPGYNNLGGALHGQGDFNAAAAAFRELVRLTPFDGQAFSHLGTALAESGQFDEAIEANLRACELAPRSAKCRINLAVAYRLKGDYQRALAAYRESIALDPTDAFARNSFGLLWKETGYHAAAVQELKAALRLNPNYAVALDNLGDTYTQMNDPESAIPVLLEAVRLVPNSASVLLNLGNAYRESGDTDAAVRSFNTAALADPNYAAPHTNLGNIYNTRGDHAAAAAAHRAALARSPNFAIAHLNLGNALRDAGDTDGALAALNKAISLSPEPSRVYANAHASLAGIYLRLERYDDAVASAERVVALVPAFAEGYAVIGRARFELGDPAGARAALLVAARLDPEKWTDRLVKLYGPPVAPPPRAVERP